MYCCVIEWSKLLYYCNIQRNGAYQNISQTVTYVMSLVAPHQSDICQHIHITTHTLKCNKGKGHPRSDHEGPDVDIEV